MRPLSLVLVLLFAVVACEPQKTGGLTITDFVKELRNAQMHNIRSEKHRVMQKQMKAADAADVYVGNQHVIVLQAAPEIDARRYGGMFNGYLSQKWTLHTNQNLLMLAEPETQQEIIDIFLGTR